MSWSSSEGREEKEREEKVKLEKREGKKGKDLSPVPPVKLKHVRIARLPPAGKLVEVVVDYPETILDEFAAHVGRFGWRRGIGKDGDGGKGRIVDVGRERASHFEKRSQSSGEEKEQMKDALRLKSSAGRTEKTISSFSWTEWSSLNDRSRRILLTPEGRALSAVAGICEAS
jgi:hypothetical protein